MRIAVLVSGTGTNLASLLRAQADGELAPAEIVLVLSNRPGVAALDVAAAAGVAAVVIDHRQHADRAGFDRACLDELRRHQVDAVVLAGFMRLLGPDLLDAFPGRVINTHPSLLPAFPGVDAPAQALAWGVKVSGCTVHFVDGGVDSGPIIFQAAVEVRADDDRASLHRRIQAEEHRLLPRATALLAAGRLQRDGRQVRVS
ncbi:MAG TPA: phosphoribosylglycinamide formyltransferase [Kofleriaceae bacterium]|nr:phosphoribosylglycinamide formyltransferase [Kofleriaceae bacterium]